jgi:hypothetical protein
MTPSRRGRLPDISGLYIGDMADANAGVNANLNANPNVNMNANTNSSAAPYGICFYRFSF